MLDVVTVQTPGHCQIFFNISAAVGVNSPNDPIDVQLVQLGYACAGINGRSPAPADLRALFVKVIPGSPYSGSPSDPLSQAIAAHERIRKIATDGRVSRMKGGSAFHPGPKGQELYLLSALGNNIAEVLSRVYPRIDLDPKCPPQLGAHVKLLLRI
jgi:hypothetical protein